MGIPGLFTTINRKYGSCNKKLDQLPQFDKKIRKAVFDFILFDMNSLYHLVSSASSRRVSSSSSGKSEYDKGVGLLLRKKLDFHLERLTSTKAIYVSIDGRATAAKRFIQRKRRFLALEDFYMMKDSIKDVKNQFKSCLREEEWEELLEEVKPNENSDISPGTPFMDQLERLTLSFFVEQKERKRIKCPVFISTSKVPGEGEHKMMQFLRFIRQNIPDGERKKRPPPSILMVGLDGDLLFLSLAFQSPKMYILRENVFDVDTPVYKNSFDFISIDVFRKSLLSELNVEMEENDGSGHNRVIDDVVFVMMLCGNDFIPNLSELGMSQGGFERIMKTLKKYYESQNNHANLEYLTNKNEVIWSNVVVFFGYLMEIQEKLFIERLQSLKEGKEHLKRSGGEPKQQLWNTQCFHTNFSVGEIEWVRTLRKTDHRLEKLKQIFEAGIDGLEREPFRNFMIENIDSNNVFSDPSKLEIYEFEKENRPLYPKNFLCGETKSLYYYVKDVLKVTKGDLRKEKCELYMKMLQQTLYLYTTWKPVAPGDLVYHFTFAPFLRDLICYVKNIFLANMQRRNNPKTFEKKRSIQKSEAVFLDAQKKKEERISFILSDLSNMTITLKNKTLNLWKSFFVEDKKIDLDLEIDEETILKIILQEEDVKIPISSIFDYFRFFRELKMKKETYSVLQQISKITSISDICTLFRFVCDNYENDQVKNIFNPRTFQPGRLDEQESFMPSFDLSFTLFVFNMMKDRESEIRDDLKLLPVVGIIIPMLVKHRVQNIFDHLDFFGVEKETDLFGETNDKMEWMKWSGHYDVVLLCKSAANDSVDEKSQVEETKAHFKAHLVVLVLKSNFFYKMLHFKGNEFEELKQTGKICIEFLEEKVFELILEFIYTNSVATNDLYILMKLLKHAEMYQEKEMLKGVINQIREVSGEKTRLELSNVLEKEGSIILENDRLLDIICEVFSSKVSREEIIEVVEKQLKQINGDREMREERPLLTVYENLMAILPLETIFNPERSGIPSGISRKIVEQKEEFQYSFPARCCVDLDFASKRFMAKPIYPNISDNALKTLLQECPYDDIDIMKNASVRDIILFADVDSLKKKELWKGKIAGVWYSLLYVQNDVFGGVAFGFDEVEDFFPTYFDRDYHKCVAGFFVSVRLTELNETKIRYLVYHLKRYREMIFAAKEVLLKRKGF